MNQRTLIAFGVVVAALALLFGFSGILRGGVGGASKPPRLPESQLSPLVSSVESHYQSPQDYIVSSFTTHDVVFLGEFYKIAENARLVAELLPRLYAAGVRALGIEYALADDQKRIDSLVTAPTYSESEARSITLHWVATWGFQEYVDLYKAAWQLNKSLPAGSSPFRILALSPHQDWQYIKTQADMNDPKVIAKVVASGVPDAFMAQVIQREIVAKNAKALIYCGMQHSFTFYRDVAYAKNAMAQNLAEKRRAGTIISDQIGRRAFTILLHCPWPDSRSRIGLSYPAEGVMDALIQALPPDKQSAGFDTANTPLGALPIKDLPFADAQSNLTLSGFCGGYVIQGPISALHAVTPIPDFVTDADAAYAAENLPGPKTAITPKDINALIVQDAQAVQTALKQFN